MAWILHNTGFFFRQKISNAFLTFFFLSGLLLGAVLFYLSGSSLFSLMRSGFLSSVSIVSFLSCSFLPFLLSALAVFFSHPWLIILIAFVKAFLFSFVSLLTIFTFQPSGYFIRFILQIGDFISLPVLYFFWQYYLFGRNQIRWFEIVFFLSIGLLIGCFEFHVISSLCNI